MPVRVELEQNGAEWGCGRDVETLHEELGQGGGDVVGGDLRRCQLRSYLRCGDDDLRGHPVHLGVDGAQRFVPFDHVGHGRAQRDDVEVTDQFDGDGQILRCRIDVETVEEPHPALGERQRNEVRQLGAHERNLSSRSREFVQLRRESRHRRRLEDGPNTDRGVRRGTDARRHPGRHERVTAESEELVVGSDDIDAEHVAEHLRHHDFRRGRRSAEGTLLDIRCRERAPVELAVGGQRKCVEHDGRSRNHVPGERAGGERRQVGHVDGRTGGGDHIGDQLISGDGRLPNQHHGRLHRRVPAQHGLDLPEFDAQTTQLDLEVGAAQVLQAPGVRRGLPPAHQIAGAVHARTRFAERIRQESICCQIYSTEVAAGQLDSGEIELTCDSGSNRGQSGVEDVRSGVPHRNTDRNQVDVRLGHLVIGDVDSRFGGSVEVVQRHARQDASDAFADLGGQRLSGGEQSPQRRGCGRRLGCDDGDEDLEQRRHEVCRRDRLRLDGLEQVLRVSVPVRLRDDQRRPDLQRPEQFPHRHVERDGGLVQHDIVGDELVFRLHPQQTVDDCLVCDGHALRLPGRPGREDDVCGVRRCECTDSVRVGDRCIGDPGQVENVDVDHVEPVGIHRVS